MPAVASIIYGAIQNAISYINLSCSYFKRKNPAMAALSNLVKTIYVLLTSGKRIKILKYQVQLMHYRMHQMEKLIQENNPKNLTGGQFINKYR